jgi:WD40 repeat protein
LGKWPLLLSLVNSALRARIERGQSLEEALAWINRALDKRGLTFFDVQDAEARDQAVSLTLGVSLELLDEEEQARYAELAVFPEDLDIPLAAIEVLWGSTGGLDDFDVEELCQRLANHSLVQHLNLNPRMLRLHDVVRSYLIDQCANLSALHARLLDAYAAQCEGSWSTGPDDDYFFLYLPHHLVHAGRRDDVRALLLDFDWLWTKLQATDINALLADYDLALSNKSPMGEDRALQLVQGALRLSAHVLAVVPEQLPGQLLGRLIPFECEGLDGLNAQARAFQKKTWLCPVISSLTPPGGPLLRTLSANRSVINQVHLSADDQEVISASSDGAIRIWDLKLGKANILGQHKHPIIVFTISNNRQKLASVTPDGAIVLWNLADRTQHLRVSRYDNVRAATFLQQDQILALGLSNGDIALFHVEKNEEIDRLTGHEKRTNSLIAMKDDSVLASASVDGTIKLWDITSGKVLCTLGDRRSAVRCLAVEPDEKYIVSGSDSGEIALWSLDSGKQLARSTQLQDVVYGVVFTQPSRHLVTATGQGFIGRWDQKLGDGIHIVYQHAHPVYSLAAFRSSDKVVAAAADGTLMIVNTGALDPERKSSNSKINAWAIFPNHNSAVTVSQDTTLQIRDLQSGRIRELFQAPAGITSAVATPGNKPFLVLGTKAGRLLCLDMSNGQEVWSSWIHKRRINGLDVSPTCHMVASASSDRSVKFWNPYDGERIGSVTLSHKREVTAVRFLAEGEFVVSASPPNVVRMWQVSTGEVVQTFKLPDLVNDMAVVKDSKSLILGFQNGQIASYDLVTGELAFRLSGHAGSVNALVVLDERELIVSASDDRSLKVWSLKSRSLCTTFHGDSEMVACKALSDGSRILAIERSGRVHILELRDSVRNLEKG